MLHFKKRRATAPSSLHLYFIYPAFTTRTFFPIIFLFPKEEKKKEKEQSSREKKKFRVKFIVI